MQLVQNLNHVVATFLIALGVHINIFLIIKVKIIMLIKWSYWFPSPHLYMLINDHHILAHICLVSVLRITPKQAPFKYRVHAPVTNH